MRYWFDSQADAGFIVQHLFLSYLEMSYENRDVCHKNHLRRWPSYRLSILKTRFDE